MDAERDVLMQLAAALEAAGAALRQLAQRPAAAEESPLTTHHAPAPAVLTRREAAERLAMSERTLARLEEAGELRPIRRGRYVRYAAGAIEE